MQVFILSRKFIYLNQRYEFLNQMIGGKEKWGGKKIVTVLFLA
jgi:hypothetical protein